MPTATDNLTLIESILSRMLRSGDAQALLDALADDVVLTIRAESGVDTYQGTGRAAVLDYFRTCGDLVTFWRVKQAWSGAASVIALVEESFTLQPGELDAHSELALLFDFGQGLITRLCILEDPHGAPGLDSRPAQRAGRFPTPTPAR